MLTEYMGPKSHCCCDLFGYAPSELQTSHWIFIPCFATKAIIIYAQFLAKVRLMNVPRDYKADNCVIHELEPAVLCKAT